MPMPETRCSASAMFGSGKRPMASAETMLTVLSACRCWLSARHDDIAGSVAGHGDVDDRAAIRQGHRSARVRTAEILDTNRHLALRRHRHHELALEIGGGFAAQFRHHDTRARQGRAVLVMHATGQDARIRLRPAGCRGILGQRGRDDAGTSDRHGGCGEREGTAATTNGVHDDPRNSGERNNGERTAVIGPAARNGV